MTIIPRPHRRINGPEPAPSKLPAHRRVAGFSGIQMLGIVIAAMLVTAGMTYGVVRTYILPTDFKPVELSQSEQLQLDSKLRALGIDPSSHDDRIGLAPRTRSARKTDDSRNARRMAPARAIL